MPGSADPRNSRVYRLPFERRRVNSPPGPQTPDQSGPIPLHRRLPRDCSDCSPHTRARNTLCSAGLVLHDRSHFPSIPARPNPNPRPAGRPPGFNGRNSSRHPADRKPNAGISQCPPPPAASPGTTTRKGPPPFCACAAQYPAGYPPRRIPMERIPGHAFFVAPLVQTLGRA